MQKKHNTDMNKKTWRCFVVAAETCQKRKRNDKEDSYEYTDNSS